MPGGDGRNGIAVTPTAAAVISSKYYVAKPIPDARGLVRHARARRIHAPISARNASVDKTLATTTTKGAIKLGLQLFTTSSKVPVLHHGCRWFVRNQPLIERSDLLGLAVSDVFGALEHLRVFAILEFSLSHGQRHLVVLRGSATVHAASA